MSATQFYGGQPQPAYGAPPGQYPPGGEYYTRYVSQLLPLLTL